MKVRFLLAMQLAFLLAQPVRAQDADPSLLSPDRMNRWAPQWRYHPGDAAAWSSPDFDDSGWEARTEVWFEPGDLPRSGWTGIGWFRTRFTIDPALYHRPLGLAFYGRGAAEVYLDGALIGAFGKVATDATGETSVVSLPPNPSYLFFSFDAGRHHTLAVRHSNFVAARVYKIGGAVAGFELSIEPPLQLASRVAADVNSHTAVQFFFTGIPLAIALLYLIFFAFYPRERNYLFFALLCAAVASMTFLDMRINALKDGAQYVLSRRYNVLAGLFIALTFLRFVYALFRPTLPRRFWFILALAIALSVWGWVDPFGEFATGNLIGLFVLADVLWTVLGAIRRRQPGAWIVGTGLIVFLLGCSYDMLLDLGWMQAIGEVTDGYFYGFLALLVSMAAFLARDVARANDLSAENLRQTKELEAARTLQLSLLPKAMPEHPDYALAALMRTAAEVGGDYYDFHVSKDGALTMVIGDATGHGMQAGTMVTATKSLFGFLCDDAKLDRALEKASLALRRMGTQKLYMALALARVRNGTLELAGAGMPPALHYKAATGTVESIPLKGVPLGGPAGFPYGTTVLPLEQGDTVLLMSDGFPELFSETGEMLGYDRAASVFEEAAHKAPAEIIAHLAGACGAWAGNRPLEDDVTFVALSAKSKTL